MRPPLSWSMRFALALSAVFAIGTLSAGGLSYLLLSHEMTARLSADVRSSAESLAQLAATGDRTDLREQILAQVRSSRDSASLYAFVDAGSGQALGSLHVAEPFEGPGRLLVGQDIPESDATGTESAEAYLAYGIRHGGAARRSRRLGISGCLSSRNPATHCRGKGPYPRSQLAHDAHRSAGRRGHALAGPDQPRGQRHRALPAPDTRPDQGRTARCAAIAALHRAELVLEDNGPGLRASLVFQPLAPMATVLTKV